MANTTIGFGAVLVVIGVIGYFATGSQSPTALIPAAFGFVLIALGIIARNEKLRKHAMHGAAVIGLLGFLGSAGGLWQLVQMMGDAEVQRPEAAIARSIMAIVCVAFVAMTVRSFIAARKARATQ
jgi:hypothetical protein